MENQNQGLRKYPKVVLVPAPFQGHISPMLELGAALHSKGFSIVIAHTIFNSPNPSNHPDFTFLPITDNLSDGDTSPENIFGLVKTINEKCEQPLRESLAQMMHDQQMEVSDRIACIIYDTAMWFCEAVASHFNIACMNFRAAGASSDVAFSEIPRLLEQGHIPRQSSMLHDQVPGLSPIRFADLSIHEIGSIEDLLETMKHTINTRNCSAVIWNTINHLEQTALAQFKQKHQAKVFPVGPLHTMAPPSATSLREVDTNCIAWLDRQAPHSVIYVSLGSIASMQEKEVTEMAWGLANSGHPFLWVVRADDESTILPNDFKETIGVRGCIVKWAPQRQVLAHEAVGGFWSHCGWNSTLESLSEGVPMICWPCFGDQKINARYLSEVWGVGQSFEHEMERNAIEQSIRRLMDDDEGETCRLKTMDMKEMIRLSVSEGGCSYNSLNDLAELILSF